MLSQVRSWLKRKFTREQRVQPSLPTRKLYQKPTVRQPNAEQAKLKIMGHSVMGNKGAKELLEMLFRGQRKKNSERRTA